MIPGLEHRRLASFDGTQLAYQIRGEGPAIVLANGLGGTYVAFKAIYDLLATRYRILCWDYRGLFRSGRPADLRTLAIPHHCRDLERLLAHEGIERAVFIGWSMGVQVNFEMWRSHRARIAGLMAINGTYGTPFRTALASRFTRYVIPTALATMKAQSRLIGAITRRATSWEGLLPLLRATGMISKGVDVDVIRAVMADFAGLDFETYSEQMRLLGEHDAKDVLTSIDVPTTIVTGDKDHLTPMFMSEKMHRRIAGSTLVVARGASHYAPVEAAATVQKSLADLLDQVVGWEFSTGRVHSGAKVDPSGAA